MTIKPPFGRVMRDTHFSFHPSYTPLNHGSFGAYPRLVQEEQDKFTKLAAERPDTFIVYDLPNLIDESREAVAPLLGVPVHEIVFVPNATTGVNTVLRNLKFEQGDVVIHFSTVYGACEKTLSSIAEMMPLQCESIALSYAVEDEDILRSFRERVASVREAGGNIRLAMFDTVLIFPGVRMPWEDLVLACKELGILSLIDGAHGIGHIDLTHLGTVGPDFFVSNCHKWLYTPRGCAVFHVPIRNQHLIRTCLPTSHGYQYIDRPEVLVKSPFVHLFEFVTTIDYTPYLCVPKAIEFRKKICARVAESPGTEVMRGDSGIMNQCCFTNIKLPFTLRAQDKLSVSDTGDSIGPSEVSRLQKWLNLTACKEFDTYLEIAPRAGAMLVRLSGQIYLALENFEWVGCKLKELCDRARTGEFRN
ncbi:aminotransferase family protein-like protein [Tothia fuscella]|uniref:Aminotransferase family protein-like protein n=1 Tax=Tothia fuscella TaxID=1048955 RepID=A0A9P4NU13_9PEZI|nr:aminotransferase family protein-like protein [Tothia fuscella]